MTIDPVVRKRLQACFQQAAAAANVGNFDYATELLAHCVQSDPSRLMYLNTFLSNLKQKFQNNKQGENDANIKLAGRLAQLKECAEKSDWPSVISYGLEILRINPWHVDTLLTLATACEHLDYRDSELRYLRMALDADLKHPAANLQVKAALARLGFDREELPPQAVPPPVAPPVAQHQGAAFAKGRELEKEGAWRDAIDAYWLAQENDETAEGPALLGIARCYLKMKQYRIAMMHARQASEVKGAADVEREAKYLVGRLAMILRGIDPG